MFFYVNKFVQVYLKWHQAEALHVSQIKFKYQTRYTLVKKA